MEHPSDLVFKAVRFSSTQLSEWVDIAIVRTAKGNRSKFVREAAKKMARSIVKKDRLTRNHLLPIGHHPRGSLYRGVRTNVGLNERDLKLIEKAAHRTNHHVSPFITWAALLKAQNILGYKGDEWSKRKIVEHSPSIASRFPIGLVQRMDRFCKENGWKRTDFVNEACLDLLEAVRRGRLSKKLLPLDHSMNGEKKMVSVKVDPDVKEELAVQSARFNHTLTGFVIWASFAYLL